MSKIKDIKGFEGYYRIESNGTVWCCRAGKHQTKWRRMSPSTHPKKGHKTIILKKPGTNRATYVHTLVLEAFVGPRPHKHEARHFPDRNPTNNRLKNLSWATRSENASDMLVHKTAPMMKLNPHKVNRMRGLKKLGWTYRRIASKFKVNYTTAREAILGLTWKAPLCLFPSSQL